MVRVFNPEHGLVKRIEKMTITINGTHSEECDISEIMDMCGIFNQLATTKDTFEAKFNFDIIYYGDALKNLETIEKAFDAGFLVSANVEELEHGKCIFKEVLKKLDSIQERIQK